MNVKFTTAFRIERLAQVSQPRGRYFMKPQVVLRKLSLDGITPLPYLAFEHRAIAKNRAELTEF